VKLSAVPVDVRCLISHGDVSSTVTTTLLAYNRSEIIMLVFSSVSFSHSVFLTGLH